MVRDEISTFLNDNVRNGANKSRDISLIMYYLGLSGEVAPSYEECAKKFNVGDQNNPGRKAERPRQIVHGKFYKKARLSYFPSLKILDEYLSSLEFISDEDYYSFCEKNNIADVSIHPFSLIRILSEFDKTEAYKLFTLNFDEVSRAKAVMGDDFVIAKESIANNYRDALFESKTLPGSIGIAKLEYINAIVDSYKINKETLVKAMKYDKGSWFDNINGEDYYLFENRDNMYINYLEKISSIAEGDDIDNLAFVIKNASVGRTAKIGEYPSLDVVKRYLSTSRFTIRKNNYIKLNIQKKELNEIEKTIVDYMDKDRWYSAKVIRNFLEGLGVYGKVYIDKSVYGSPLIYVDKALGRKNYQCRLIGKQYLFEDNALERYELFKQKLMRFSTSGTNYESEVILRKEQQLLRDWLFADTTHSNCAICERRFSNKALVAAHKKKRANCSENERIDPYIVMPLCIFGCDYLYENKIIGIADKKVYCNYEGIEKNTVEYELLKEVDGNHISDKWCNGSPTYFR